MRKIVKLAPLIIGLVAAFAFGGLISIIYPFFDVFFGACPVIKKTFQYQGCSVNYSEINDVGRCTPCGGILPCVSGFEPNKRIETLSCLCKNNNLRGAESFARQYMFEEPYTIKKSTRLLTEEDFTDICNKIPEKLIYM